MTKKRIIDFVDVPGTILLRPHDFDSEDEGGDYDFLEVGGDQLGLRIEEKLGTPLVKITRTYVHQRYYEWGQIDVLPSLEWNGFRYADTEAVIAAAVVGPDGIRRPRLGHDGFISWLTSLLWGGVLQREI
ncbi:hypothetical protein N9198_02385 [Akkermansiaceae bacterium]|nr:hypothetical protein [Akkermansiaceae bacterium]MDB4407593.1 hypothetical protein [Akkermansiaceae bacterium]MDB4526214.1 hypothetical protein [Akkermansiaceae bacterium]MDB4527704.1 hypothetical protein [Akkermansiaceae bacterium]MDB4531863.1 hypothetical protein [Akkermansiaceae bacterium]